MYPPFPVPTSLLLYVPCLLQHLYLSLCYLFFVRPHCYCFYLCFFPVLDAYRSCPPPDSLTSGPQSSDLVAHVHHLQEGQVASSAAAHALLAPFQTRKDCPMGQRQCPASSSSRHGFTSSPWAHNLSVEQLQTEGQTCFEHTKGLCMAGRFDAMSSLRRGTHDYSHVHVHFLICALTFSIVFYIDGLLQIELQVIFATAKSPEWIFVA